ncbi:deazaflavin-dependent oxidoreductase (nitroreductase family) [Halopolyspora algeriensis]|uniref:Deazaflavin-dependent oxidoreductase (Nitroreductase family) n=1 Tax=Halopolyspora algeriensis TaxID=1500506 RepID=A0A368VVA8_9ACTN|nr:nitroreductase family deazaflavin-dependent oxidoreductase [Halopolyspora algeriensis]RCW45226.1 deazaflavin-dependent oxidoreductase (nitroreductase family) [Halopolyspora algeriensis]TQM53055.1 deazaflavin-dependent oxidoreductase (nitroreductase family) [Halopolyspora algeriensis]
MEILNRPELPTGFRRLLFRLPVHLYRWRLGWLLGRRFLLVNHIGRVSGQPRQVVLEIVEHDPATGSCTVASGFGAGADWYKNVRTTPEVTIRVGRHELPVTATPLPAADGEQVMVRYALRHPGTAKRLARFMGFAVNGSEADFRAVGARIPFVRFAPR